MSKTSSAQHESQPKPILKNGSAGSTGGVAGVSGLLMPTQTPEVRALSAERLHLIGGVPPLAGYPPAGGELQPVSRERLVELLERASTLNRSLGVGGGVAGLTFEQRLQSLAPLLAQHSGNMTLPPNLSALAQMNAAQRPLLPVRERDEERDESDGDDAELSRVAEVMQQRTQLLPPSYTNHALPAALLLRRPHSAASATIPRLRTNPFFGNEGRLQADSLLPPTPRNPSSSTLSPRVNMPLPVSVPVVGSLNRPFLSPAAPQVDSSTLKLFTEQNANAHTAASLSLSSGGFAPASTAISNGPATGALAPAARALSSAAWIPPPVLFSNVMTGFSRAHAQAAQQTALEPMLCAGSASKATSSQQAAAAMPTSVGAYPHEAREDRATRRRRRRASSKPGSECGPAPLEQPGSQPNTCAQPAAGPLDAPRTRPPLAIPVPYPPSALLGRGAALHSVFNTAYTTADASARYNSVAPDQLQTPALMPTAVPTLTTAKASVFPHVHEMDAYVLK